MKTASSDSKHEKPGHEGIALALQAAVANGMLRSIDGAAIFYDLTFLRHRLLRLLSAFPAGTLHGLAIKANPLVRIMEFTSGISPFIGVEAASAGEVMLALRSGYPPRSIVFDSPAKTREDIQFALKTGVHLNIDNLAELKRVDEALKNSLSAPGNTLRISDLSIGIRINPQVGLGTILESSVAGEYSKFGVPIRYQYQELRKAFLDHEWLRGLHLHVGSQGCAVDMLAEGIGILYDFMTVINEDRKKSGMPPADIFDIGGGLPVSYLSGVDPPAIEMYAEKIARRAPLLFDQGRPVRLITEFGRWTYTNAGWTVSRVEYVKRDPTINTLMLHVGADLFVRECLNPRDWPHEYTVYDKAGRPKQGVDDHPYNLAGPLCFSGDIIARNVTLPRVEEGDLLVIHDTGSYTFSMWSRYNSRLTPRILGYEDDGKSFLILKEREELDDIWRFWQ